ncbi:hypothetical protein BS50DRAFT_205493 [Corynespora cassiicola Philippines]|uniref:Prolyl 4-hydroxylase alpha subunit domain-containing protein n=1 Tax=Corynespora cassiicola Philippines TaxID=1448308 RepID=A0A2T2N5B2_CORCC|nr:hypothetical protein BS50DRAFT_205493 [Corynespora cassiicola Philippines]
MAPSTSSSLSFGTAFQYAFLAVLGYVLAGAPLLSILSGKGPDEAGGRRRDGAGAVVSTPIPLDKVDSLVIPETGLECEEEAGYKTYIFSREPLVVYVEGFVSERERRHVVELSEPKFKPSTVWTAGNERLDPTVRLSEKAQLDRDDTVKCIEERARVFQGYRPHVYVEKLWSQRYNAGGHYTYHYDWSTASRSSGRISSFMVYLEANCTGGGTHFPRLDKPNDETWCKFIECGDEEEDREGTTFKPIAGNAVYWENIRPDGRGYDESWHAGLPVKSGTKIGLNIWSWYQAGWTPEASSVAASASPPSP